MRIEDGTPTAPTTVRAWSLAACASAVLLATTGCGVAGLVTSEKTREYDTVADAPTEGDLAFRLPTGLLPEDATDIDVRVKTDDPNLKAYDWRSDSGRLPEECEPSRPPARVDPFYTSGGWPDEAVQSAGQRCGALFVTEVDGHFYAAVLSG